MSDDGLWFVLAMFAGMTAVVWGLPRHFAWLDRRQAEREAAATKLLGGGS